MVYKGKIIISALILGLAILYNERLVYHVVINQCQWPTKWQDAVRAMLLTDVHLVGPKRGNWFERTRVEAQMRRVYQKAISLHQPDVVFILGDLFDEGQYVDDEYFEEYLQRFNDTFKTPPHIKRICAVGNHDVGFHYRLRRHDKLERFTKVFKESDNSLITIKNTHFVILNSITLYGDGCRYCTKTEADIRHMSKRLQCAKDKSNSTACNDLEDKLPFYSRPILIQHYPTFREDDQVCLEHDYLELEDFEPNREVLSENATKIIGNSLKPAVAFCGHSHHYCRSINMWNAEEYTISSFSWQHKSSPSFLLVEFSGDEYAVSKCDMPKQTTVIFIYLLSICSIVLIAAHTKRTFLRNMYFTIFTPCFRTKVRNRYSALV